MSAERYKTFCREENVVSCRKDATQKNTRNTHLGTVNISILASNDNNFKMFSCFQCIILCKFCSKFPGDVVILIRPVVTSTEVVLVPIRPVHLSRRVN